MAAGSGSTSVPWVGNREQRINTARTVDKPPAQWGALDRFQNPEINGALALVRTAPALPGGYADAGTLSPDCASPEMDSPGRGAFIKHGKRWRLRVNGKRRRHQLNPHRRGTPAVSFLFPLYRYAMAVSTGSAPINALTP